VGGDRPDLGVRRARVGAEARLAAAGGGERVAREAGREVERDVARALRRRAEAVGREAGGDRHVGVRAGGGARGRDGELGDVERRARGRGGGEHEQDGEDPGAERHEDRQRANARVQVPNRRCWFER
jgi:hypothetical protein